MGGSRRDAAVDEHVHNIRMGLAVLDRDYGIHIDEYDYLDLAITFLKDIKNFGTTEYLAILKTNALNEAVLPCNVDTIDAVTSVKMGLKVFGDRKRYTITASQKDDIYINAAQIMAFIGEGLRNHIPGISSYAEPAGYYSYQLEGKKIKINRDAATTIANVVGRDSEDGYGIGELADESAAVAVAYTGIATDDEGYPLINLKQATALAVLTAKNVLTKKAIRGDRNAMGMLEFLSSSAARLKQAASIPENITDNEIDELLDAKTSFHRKRFGKATKYSR